MVLSVRKRIHWGMGRFCLAFLASFILIRKVFCDGCIAETTSCQASAKGSSVDAWRRCRIAALDTYRPGTRRPQGKDP